MNTRAAAKLVFCKVEGAPAVLLLLLLSFVVAGAATTLCFVCCTVELSNTLFSGVTSMHSLAFSDCATSESGLLVRVLYSITLA